jgi:hypothetical protein
MPVYLINIEQIGISEQFCDEQKVPYYQVRLYYILTFAIEINLIKNLWINS